MNDPQAPAPGAPVVRRLDPRSRMLSPEAPGAADNEVIIGRSLLSTQRDSKPQTSRQRRIAGALPDWEPVPPGEIVVRRARR